MGTMAISLRQIWDTARRRGADHFAAVGPRESGCLSGEWAGESVAELLGDLIDQAETLYGQEWVAGDLASEICAEFEAGYENAWADAA